MFKTLKYILPVLITTLIVAGVSYGATVLFPYQGGTGTSTVPVVGQVLVGQANGTYAPQATSTLGITSGSSRITYLATTTATFTGQITTSTLTGYKAANNVCASQFSGTHLCTDGEIMSYIDNGSITSWGSDQSTAWYAEVAPGYLANANDCNGYTSEVSTYLGSFYVFNATDGGYGALVNCSNSKPLACCK